MTEPLVSVLVPAYRAAPYIANCLQSVMAQSYPHLELILVDDCSPDDTFDIARQTIGSWPRATVLRNAVNLGNRANFQSLLALGKGSLIKFVCNDDVLRPDAVARLVDALESDKDIALATSWRTPIDASGAALPIDSVPQPPLEGDAVIPGTAAGNHLLRHLRNWIGEPTTVLFRRDLLPIADLYRLGVAAPARNLDVVWWLKLLSRGSLAVVGDSLSQFRLHAGQVTQQVSRSELVLAWYDIIVGARSLGFLSDPTDEIAAWSAFASILGAQAPVMEPDARPRALEIAQLVSGRLGELCVA